MGFKKPIDSNSVISELRRAYTEINSPYNDGFTGWQVKHELYEIKWLLDRILKNSTTFGEIEERYLDEIEKNKIIEELKK
jgi:hypothetical protein